MLTIELIVEGSVKGAKAWHIDVEGREGRSQLVSHHPRRVDLLLRRHLEDAMSSWRRNILTLYVLPALSTLPTLSALCTLSTLLAVSALMLFDLFPLQI